MKSLSQKYLQKRNNYFLSIFLPRSGKLCLLFLFIIFVFLNKEKLFQTFNPEVVNRYLKSQDILDINGEIKDRVIVSDEEIYIATGYLYANGAKPIDYNFQHPPFIKYLFGFSAKYFNLPLLPNIIFAGLLLFEVYLLGEFVFKNRLIGFLASLLLLIDPIFKEVTIYALLDLGQMVFILGFIITTFFWKKHWIGQGTLLGLAMASKFYSPVIIFLGIIYLYKMLTKQFELRKEAPIIFVTLVTFALTYTVFFIKGDFNLVFNQAKIIKFMLDHNQAVEWGGVVPMFFGGYFVWPILFFANLFAILNTKFRDQHFLLFLIPILYSLVLCFQLPFTRYFILILPFLYLSLSKLLCEKLLSH